MSYLYMNRGAPPDNSSVSAYMSESPSHLLAPPPLPHEPLTLDDNRPDHSCRYCGKHCETPSQLAIHIRAHTGERPYSCPYCDYRATQKHHVKSHLQRRHKDHHLQDQIPDPAP
ncbi:hypothetical protein SK128_011935 [Halocaridina rubra]|uniref:C2H2-type domain-containing protein n=1 Tax=Halocaridina rubra TaxID=373956 RepID=A0AAN8WQ39_HALRR